MRSANSAVGHALLRGKIAAALDALHHHVSGLERALERLVDGFGFLGVVGCVVADIHIECRPVPFGPGMYRQMRFREHDRTRGATLLGAVDAVELVEMVSEDGKARLTAG